jgi:hypothetical protein
MEQILHEAYNVQILLQSCCIVPIHHSVLEYTEQWYGVLLLHFVASATKFFAKNLCQSIPLLHLFERFLLHD